MSRRHFDLALSDMCLLVGSAFVLALIGLVLSREAEVAAPPAAKIITASPIAFASCPAVTRDASCNILPKGMIPVESCAASTRPW
jgi:hypothetical protein